MRCPCIDCKRRGCGIYHDICPKYNEWNEMRQAAATRRKLDADATDAQIKARLRVKGGKR